MHPHPSPQNWIIGDRIIRHTLRTVGTVVPATLLRFPKRFRVSADRIAKIAAAMKLKRSDDAAETYLAGELRRYRRERQAQGIPSTIVNRELHALEPAIRGELWRLIFGPPTGTGRRR
jgi:hypothetical protein